jgi:hypothetical protein
MALYRLTQDKLEQLDRTSFEKEGIRERTDLQRIIRDQPDVLEEGLFIVSEEFSNWEDSSLRIDLLGISVDARLVVIELKRDERGGVMELQAVRYAAMVSNMTLGQIVDAHQVYLQKRGSAEDAKTRIYEHLGATEHAEPEIYSERPRILLVSGDFSKELTTSVLWLNQSGLDIRCMKLQLYRTGDGLLVETNQVIPLPEAEHYLIQVREKADEAERLHAKSGPLEPGGESFRQTIDAAPAQSKPMLERLYHWAVGLEHEGLIELSTYHGARGVTTLLMRLPMYKGGLVTIYNSSGGAYLQLWRSVFERRAPQSIATVEKLISPNLIGQGTTLRNISDALLECLTAAYQEAHQDLES